MMSDLQMALNQFKEEERRPIHSFHRYFGKLVPGIPGFAIETYSKLGDRILDPFSGSGTTVVEARERGREGFGFDLNPLANFVARVKTTPLNEEDMSIALLECLKTLTFSNQDEIFVDPYVVNLDHWFRPEVKLKLHGLKQSINRIDHPQVRDFLMGVFSAFLRGVSNADPRHVFPGYSKRMRALDEQGRKIDVEASFLRAAKKRIKQVASLSKDGLASNIFNGDFRSNNIESNSIDLVVTNPPYISSIRYLETMKIEMGWMGYLHSQNEYLSLDKKVIGTERFYKGDLVEIEPTGYPSIDDQIESLISTNRKMAKTVSRYFLDMDEVLKETSRVLKTGGHLVIKISDSKVRNEVIATHQHFVEICAKYGVKLQEDIIDEFDPNSRSLLTARNSYSGIMTFDHVLIFRAE